MGEHLNFSNLLLDDIDNEIPVALNLSTPSTETPRVTKKVFSISDIEHCTDAKYDQITLNNFKRDILLEIKRYLPSREDNNKNAYLERFLTVLENQIASVKNEITLLMDELRWLAWLI